MSGTARLVPGLLFLTAAACANRTPPTEDDKPGDATRGGTRVVAGVVRDERGNPMRVKLSVDPRSPNFPWSSDAAGRFRIPNVPPDAKDLIYQDADGEVGSDPLPAGSEPMSLVIYRHPGIAVTVLDADGRRLHKIRVTARLVGSSGPDEEVYDPETDGDGTMGLPAGRYLGFLTALGGLLLASALPPLAAPVAAETRPPDPYVVDGLVTDDMSYGWIATREIRLFTHPGSRRQVAVVVPGEVMHAEALQIRGRPWEVRVLHDKGALRAGMRLWILARDMEEGSYQLWFGGETRDDLQEMISFELVGKQCGRGSADCWLRFETEPAQENWVRVRTERAVVGWLRRKKHDDFRIDEKRLPHGATGSVGDIGRSPRSSAVAAPPTRK